MARHTLIQTAVIGVLTLSACNQEPTIQYDPTGLRQVASIGRYDAWTTDQIEAAIRASDCGTLSWVHEYTSTHSEIAHDGPLSTYTGHRLDLLGCAQ